MNESLTLFGLATTPLELLSFALSIVTVWLNIRQNHWAWLFAILSSAMYGVVFFDSKLYGDMGLQVVFISVSVWGWYQWLHGDDTHERLPVTELTWRGRAWAAAAWLAAFGALAWGLHALTDTDVPFADGFLTAGSLVGQVLLSRKRLENWHVWIIVDVLYVALYIHKGLMLTAVLYAMFVFMAAVGLRAWRRSMEQDIGADAAMVLR
jgi:nicotinamide mononucleotide transporter